MTNNMFFLHKHIAPVSARMMTWEVTTAFDETPTEMELRKRFDEEFRDAYECEESQVCFCPLVSFNAADGRRHRYLVAVADEMLINYRKKFDRCLPKQVMLFAIADKILRGTWTEWVNVFEANHKITGEQNAETDFLDGNLLLVALWNQSLYILVFMGGRLCHWSEECGFGKSFDEQCRKRVSLFKKFLHEDELFANDAGALNEFYVQCNTLSNTEELFRAGTKAPFWHLVDLDKCESMKFCEKRRWILKIAVVFALCVALAVALGGRFVKSAVVEVLPVELSQPSAHDLEKLAWANGHRDLFPAKWGPGHGKFWGRLGEVRAGRRNYGECCNPPEFKLLGIVGGRAVLVKMVTGETKILSLGDTLLRYRVKWIGVDEVVLLCGRKEVRYAIETR